LKFRKMYWLIGRKSTLSLHNKLLLYKQLLKPAWTYSAQLWGCTKQSNRDIIQRFKNKVLRSIVNAPWYIRNSDDNLHRDLEMETVDNTIKKFARSFMLFCVSTPKQRSSNSLTEPNRNINADAMLYYVPRGPSS